MNLNIVANKKRIQKGGSIYYMKKEFSFRCVEIAFIDFKKVFRSLLFLGFTFLVWWWLYKPQFGFDIILIVVDSNSWGSSFLEQISIVALIFSLFDRITKLVI